MRGIFVVALAACGGGSNSSTCTPVGDYTIPMGCDVADCHAAVCDATCATGTSCSRLDCSDSPQCRLDCQGDAMCGYVDCDQSGVCFVDCHDTGATCEVSCEGAQDCSIDCRDGAECLLHCGSATAPACELEMCTAGSGMLDCGNGLIACNRPCP